MADPSHLYTYTHTHKHTLLIPLRVLSLTHVCVCVCVGAVAGIVDQPMQTFTRTLELPSSASGAARGVISGVGKGIVGVFTKPIGGAAELVSQTGYGTRTFM